ncbi:MAG: hypothetical protein MZV70_35950 [Desulfobacterales bacterium]|nr:hypothetical protein [Desulfobacterales bacterium]
MEGVPGDFTVKVRMAPRFVDPVKCTGCGDCEGEVPQARRPERIRAGTGNAQGHLLPLPSGRSEHEGHRPDTVPCT